MFDAVICAAGKPEFFRQPSRPFRALDIHERARLIGESSGARALLRLLACAHLGGVRSVSIISSCMTEMYLRLRCAYYVGGGGGVQASWGASTPLWHHVDSLKPGWETVYTGGACTYIQFVMRASKL